MCYCPLGCVQNVGCNHACDAISLLVLNVMLAPARPHQAPRDAKRVCCRDIIVGIPNHNRLGQVDRVLVCRLKIELCLRFLALTSITALVRTHIGAKQPSASDVKLLLEPGEPGAEVLKGKDRFTNP